ncbi:MAG: NAD(+) kinase [Ignavibacteria bacterium]|nr:MAG: NAD(+) kinase [Ignavibacteria bacterium]KAF0161485.1 MAG: NAD(+) kinase [Ignavibacteria bacterium]
MTIGIIPNITKMEVSGILEQIILDITKNELDYVISNSLLLSSTGLTDKIDKQKFVPLEQIGTQSDMVVSIGGDGTMLNTAYHVRKSGTPIVGVNFGKLGFLAEFDVDSFSSFLKEVKNNNYVVEDRIALIGNCTNIEETLYAINDLVIDKGSWSKMIELTVYVDDDYVTTFAADGIIVATPTGSTGYSLSTGGPIVNPKADVITLSPISPHTLTMRPLVISSSQKIKIKVNSLHDTIQVSSDGQRVNFINPPAEINIEKSNKPVKLVHSTINNYFETLRKKLFWGLDIRQSNNS